MMESNSKKRLREFDEIEEDGSSSSSTSEDRISCLPDSILNHILSFLDTEDIVRMSFLSKRWKSFGGGIPLPGLCLCLERFSENSTLKDQKKRFTEFVDRMIVLYKDQHLEEFRLKFDISQFEIDCPQVDNWVNFVMTSDTVILHLDFWGERDGVDPDCWKQRCYTMPQCSSFPHKSVEALVLTHCVFRPSQYMSFFSIKTAVFTGVHLLDDSVYDFIAASPCLENLYLIECIVPAHLKCHVPESKLKILVVNCILSFNGEDISSLDINAPNLLHFTFTGMAIDNISLNHPKNLIEAKLNLRKGYTKLKQTGNKKELKLLKAHQQKTTETLLALRRGSPLAQLVLLP